MKKLIIALMCCTSTLFANMPAGHTQSQYLCAVESSMDSPEIKIRAHHGCFGTSYSATFVMDGTSVYESCTVEGYEMDVVQLMCGNIMMSFDGWKLNGTVSFFAGEPQVMSCMTMDSDR